MGIKKIKVSENIKRFRKERGLKSARELSIALDDAGYYCSASTVKNWESDHRHPTIEAIAALCYVLDVTSDDLLF